MYLLIHCMILFFFGKGANLYLVTVGAWGNIYIEYMVCFVKGI